MTVTLSPETQQLLDRILASGLYEDADHVVHAGLLELRAIQRPSLPVEAPDAVKDDSHDRS